MCVMQNYFIISQYAAPYRGNFIPSIEFLGDTLEKKYGYNCIYVFPESAKKCEWIKDFQELHHIEFTDDNPRSSKCVQQLKNLFNNYKPTLIHTHFDGYDESVVKASKSYSGCSIVWHLHDHLSYLNNPLKKTFSTQVFYASLLDMCERKCFCNSRK